MNLTEFSGTRIDWEYIDTSGATASGSINPNAFNHVNPQGVEVNLPFSVRSDFIDEGWREPSGPGVDFVSITTGGSQLIFEIYDILDYGGAPAASNGQTLIMEHGTSIRFLDLAVPDAASSLLLLLGGLASVGLFACYVTNQQQKQHSLAASSAVIPA